MARQADALDGPVQASCSSSAMPGYGAWMPVEFLSDAEAAAFGRFVGAPSRDDRFFFLDDAGLGGRAPARPVRNIGPKSRR